MKRRCVPVRADHDLLTPGTCTLSGVRLHPAVQVRSEVTASLSGQLCDSSGSQTTVSSTCRRVPAASPTRRLRFEDETETEAESRYLERQKRQVGRRGAGVLVSKPDVRLYISGRAGSQGTDRQNQAQIPLVGLDRHGTGSGDGVSLDLHQHRSLPEDRGRSLYRPHFNLRSEPIRETYIGSVTAGDTTVEGAVYLRVANNQVRWRTNQLELNGNQVNLGQNAPTSDLPVNPYAPDQLTTRPQPSHVVLPPSTCHSISSQPSQSSRPNGTKARRGLKQNQEEPGRLPAAKSHTKIQGSPDLHLDSRLRTSSSESTVESQAPSIPNSSRDGQVKQPIRPEDQSDDTSLPQQIMRRDESSRLSLRRLFSTVKLGRTRASSLDRLSAQPRPPSPDSTPSIHRKSSGLLKKSISVQSLSVGSPIMQLRRTSIQSPKTDQKKKKDRSADYRPSADQLLQRSLSLEDVGRPCSVRSVGRVLQVGSDGTFLLEITRPASRTYGFVISRGGGRPDSGVYVEHMADSSTEKLYAGLLAVGDEILEVNGEKVAALSLDQVTHLLTQNNSASVRVLRHRRPPQRE